MLWRKTPFEQHAYEAAERWRLGGLEALRRPGIERYIEPQKLQRLQRLARGAGTILFDHTTLRVRQIDGNSDLYVMTHAGKEVPPKLFHSHKKEGLSVDIGKIAHESDRALH